MGRNEGLPLSVSSGGGWIQVKDSSALAGGENSRDRPQAPGDEEAGCASYVPPSRSCADPT